MKAGSQIVVGVIALALAAGEIFAQKKPAPPPELFGTAWIDNHPGDPCAADPATRVHSDCVGDEGAYFSDGSGTSARLNSERAFWLQTYGARYVTLDFSVPVAGSVTCGTGCYRKFPDVMHTVVPKNTSDPWTAALHGNAIDAAGVRLANGLLSLPVGAASDARFFVNFPDPDGGRFHWTLYFNPTSYPESDFVTVTRTGVCSWEIESHGRGKLVAHGVGKGAQQASTGEGVFWMPFRIAFQMQGC
jgi:hypothetical protein